MIYKILYKIYKTFMYPVDILIAIFLVYKLIKIYNIEIRNNDASLSNYQVYTISVNKISNNNEELMFFKDMVVEQIGVMRYIISFLFWIAIFSLFF